MTAKENLPRLEPDSVAEPDELTAWFTNNLRPSSAPTAAPMIDAAASSAVPTAGAIPDDLTMVEAPVDTEPQSEPAPEPIGSPPADHVAYNPVEASAGHSLAPHVLPSDEPSPDEAAADELPLAPAVAPWLPSQRSRVLATAVGASATLASLALLLFGRSCAGNDTAFEASTRAQAQQSPLTIPADQPPPPTAPEPSDSAEAVTTQPAVAVPPALGPPPPSGAEATPPEGKDWPPYGPSVARFPDLPPDVLLKAWLEAQENEGHNP